MKFSLVIIFVFSILISVFGINSDSNDSITIDGIWAFQHDKLLEKFHADCVILKFKNDTIYELNLFGDEIDKYSYKINQNDELWVKDTVKIAIFKGDKNRLIRLWDPEKYGLDWYVSIAYMVKLKPTDIRIKKRKLKKILSKNEWEILNGDKVIDEVKILSLSKSKEEFSDLSTLEGSIVFVSQIENSYMIIYKAKRKNEMDYIASVKKICKKEFEVVFSSDRGDTIIKFKKT